MPSRCGTTTSAHVSAPDTWRVQPESGFAYDQDAYLQSLDAFVEAVGLKGTEFALVTHGFVLGQYGMLWALQHRDEVACLVALGVPLGVKTKLRPELAAYKAAVPFLRPKPDGKFPADTYNAAGLAYYMNARDADVRACPPRCRSAGAGLAGTTLERAAGARCNKRVQSRSPSVMRAVAVHELALSTSPHALGSTGLQSGGKTHSAAPHRCVS